MQTRYLLNGVAIATLAVLAAGCATSGHPPPAPTALDNLTKLENLPGKPGCFWKSNFQGDWTVLNDSTLIVRAPLARDTYVIKLFEPVFTLSFKQALGFEDKEHSGQICNNGFDYLLVPVFQPPRVPITAVHAITQDEQNQLLLAAGLPLPKMRSGAQPAPAATPAPASH